MRKLRLKINNSWLDIKRNTFFDGDVSACKHFSFNKILACRFDEDPVKKKGTVIIDGMSVNVNNKIDANDGPDKINIFDPVECDILGEEVIALVLKKDLNNGTPLTICLFNKDSLKRMEENHYYLHPLSRQPLEDYKQIKFKNESGSLKISESNDEDVLFCKYLLYISNSNQPDKEIRIVF